MLLTKNKRACRWLALVAVCVVALGSTLVGAGSASAAARVGHYAHIKFWQKYRVVTMTVPTGCPKYRQAPCVWELYVNEPENPALTVVGTATALAGSQPTLQVSYPKNFCGVIQADVVIGPSPWQFETGHVREIDTFNSKGRADMTTFCPPTPGTTTPTTNNGGNAPPGQNGNGHNGNGQGDNAQASSLPFTGATTASGSPTAADAAAAGSTSPATLPFTGIDVKPLVLVGAVLILIGLFILSSLEQRRRALRRIGSAVSTGADYSSRASHWFLGD